MVRPVSFYVKDVGSDIRQILAIGNPAIFWGSIWALPWAAYSWWHRRDWRAGFILVPFLFQWLPWFPVARPQFFFYVLPCTPFMVLAVVYAIRDLSDARLVQRDQETGARGDRSRDRRARRLRAAIPTGRSPGWWCWRLWACSLVLAGSDGRPDRRRRTGS